MQNKKRSRRRQRHDLAVEILIGVLLICVVFYMASRKDMDDTEKNLSKTVNYIKDQCNNYDRLNLASETKSLLRIIQSTREINDELHDSANNGEEGQITQAVLKKCAEDSYVTGVLLMNSEGDIKKFYTPDTGDIDSLEESLKSEAILGTTDFPEKSYCVRIPCEDGAYYDLAAIGRDEDEILAVYYYTPAEYVNAFTLSIDSLLAGYNLKEDGTIVVSSGEKIVASNDKKLEGKNTSEISILKHIREKSDSDHLTHIRSGSDKIIRSFGLMEHGRKYYIYGYVSEREVFDVTIPGVVYALIIYSFIIAVIHMVRWKTVQSYQKEQMIMQKNYAVHLEKQNKQLAEAMERADQANAAKTNFLSRMSHDIRTPLNGIIGLLKINEAHSDDRELIRKNQKKMMVSAKHLLSLINDILQMSKLESGEIVLAHEPVRLQKLVEEVVVIVEQRAAESGVMLEFDEKTRNLKYQDVYGSPLHIRQIFLNIYGNCIKYNKVGGSVITSGECIENKNGSVTYRWTITDTGIGMNKEFLEHIFDPFVQEHTDARSVYNGSGLGMSIVKKLIDQMGGMIEVSSEEGTGSTFVITLPFELAEESQIEQKIKETEAASTIQGLNLLLAEDNELNAEIAEMMLEDEGAVVTIVRDGKQAIEAFKKNPPGTFDAILMDMMMPVVDGISATKTIRAMQPEREDAGQIPIIAMTANAFEEDAQKCMNAGMNAHLAKPFQMKKVIAVICKYCGNS